jgi:hypothetical protein
MSSSSTLRRTAVWLFDSPVFWDRGGGCVVLCNLFVNCIGWSYVGRVVQVCAWKKAALGCQTGEGSNLSESGHIGFQALRGRKGSVDKFIGCGAGRFQRAMVIRGSGGLYLVVKQGSHGDEVQVSRWWERGLLGIS